MNFDKTIKVNIVIWGIMFLNSLYMVYSKYIEAEVSLRQNGVLFSKVLIVQAVIIFCLYFNIERVLFRKSRLNKFIQRSPNKISIPFYFITIIGLAFAQAAIIWGAEALKSSGNIAFLFALYGVGILFLAYSFPWKWRVSIK